MNAFVTSLIRTYAPILVGALVAWLLTLGVELDGEAQAGLVVGLTGLLQGVYYTGVRALEQRWPAFGALLGKTVTPTYKNDKTIQG